MPTTLDPSALANRLIASDKVEGTAVYDADSHHIGEIRNFMVDKLSGKVAYVVMSFGGFLGIGENEHPLPWEALTYSPELGGYVVNISRERLTEAPVYRENDDPFVDPAFGDRVKGFWVT